MSKYNKLEIIGAILFSITGSWIGLEFFTEIQIFAEFVDIANIVFFFGILIWALGYNRKERAAIK